MHAQPKKSIDKSINIRDATFEQVLKLGKKGQILSIEQLDTFRGWGGYENYVSDNTSSSQFASYAPPNTSFFEANIKDRGKYNVSKDMRTGRIYRAELPKIVLGPNGREIVVAKAKNVAVSAVLDLMRDGRPTIEMHKERGNKFLIVVNDPNAWFCFKIATKMGWVIAKLQDGDVRDIRSETWNDSSMDIYFERFDGYFKDGRNWNGMIGCGWESEIGNKPVFKWRVDSEPSDPSPVFFHAHGAGGAEKLAHSETKKKVAGL
ncbi:Uncharacterised protein [Candidatus Gugararchaeum adminiculabundum]|nr:Uncharacterised protein [Candidatus Gugararchaeum adminiculabundum]